MTDEVTVDRPEFGDYPAGTEVFSAKFDADDFQDPRWLDGREYPDGAVITIRRGENPPQGWLLRHRDLSQWDRADLVFRMHADDDALGALYDLNDDAFDEFVTAWNDNGGGVTPGKSPRSTKRSKTTKRR